MNYFKALRRFGLFAGLITIVVGVLFLLFSKQVAEILAMIVGIGILAIGVIRLIQALRMSPEEGKGSKVLRVILSVIMVGIGIFLLIDNQAATTLVGLVIGVFAFFAGFDRFVIANERRKQGLPVGLTILFGIIHIIFGILMIYFSLEMLSILVVFTGIYLLCAGIMIVISAGYLRDYEIQEQMNDTSIDQDETRQP